MAYLFFLAGFGWQWEQGSATMTAQLRPKPIEFIGTNRTKSWNVDIHGFVDRIAQSLVDRLFGVEGQTAFCGADGNCAVESVRWSRQNCQPDPAARLICRRRRPEMLVIACAQTLYPTLLKKLGRAALLLPLPDETDAKGVADAISAQFAALIGIKDFLINLPRNILAPYMPYHNFQHIGSYPIAAEVQADWEGFESLMRSYHGLLHDPSFRNARRGYMIGAYKLDTRVGFQRDRLHKHDAPIGSDSRVDRYHLLNAYHTYGLPIVPHLRFDVSAHDGKRVGHSFVDVLTGKCSDAEISHLDISPDDRHTG